MICSIKISSRYFYRLMSGPEPLSTFEKDRAWHVPEELDLLAMQVTYELSTDFVSLIIYKQEFNLSKLTFIYVQEACKVLVGHHDFSSFRAAGCQVFSYLLIHVYTYGISFMLVIKSIIVDGRDYFYSHFLV